MMKKRYGFVGALCSLALFTSAAQASDHADGPQASTAPEADITDLYVWMPDGRSVNLVMNVFPSAGPDAAFSNHVLYAFHIASAAGISAPDGRHPSDAVCAFDEEQSIECWLGVEHVAGNAASEEGLESETGKLRVFAGRRSDPASWNRQGFLSTVKTIHDGFFGGTLTLTFDGAGCPTLDGTVGSLILGMLSTSPTGETPTNDFAAQDVLSLAMSVDASLLFRDGPILRVWASTNEVAQNGGETP
jgi:hypothetical protein